MLTSIIEPGSFMIGQKIFKAGDEVELSEEEQKEMDSICEIFAGWNDRRTKLLNAIHQTEDPFVIDLAQEAHELKIENFRLRYRLNILIAEVEKRLGGLLPIYFSSIKKKLIINIKPEESLVYTTKFIADTIGMPAFDFPRAIATNIVGRPNVSFDNTEDEKIEVISVFGGGGGEGAGEDRLGSLTKAIETTLDEGGPQAMSLIVLWFKDGGIRAINADAIPSTVDPNTRVLWNLKKILEETKPNGVSVVVEKAEQTRVVFSISHKDKGADPKAAEIVHTVTPQRGTEIKDTANPQFALARMTPDAIDAILE